jgi:outer membrane protein assembly factor BamB
MKRKLYIIIAFIIIIVFFYLLFIKMKTFSDTHVSESIPIGEQSIPVHGDKNNETVDIQEEYKYFHDNYNYKWSFYSGLKFCSAIDSIGDTVLFYAHDGQLSGYHEDEYLYCVDKHDGKKIWSVFGGFLPIKYCVDEVRKTIFISTLKPDPESRMLCLETQSLKISTGEEQWIVKTSDVSSMNNISLSHNTLNIEYIDNKNNNKLLSVDSHNGKRNWEIELGANEILYTSTRSIPSIIIQGEDYLKSLDPFSRKELWSLKGKIRISLNRNNSINRLSNEIKIDQNNNLLEWVICNNELTLLDISNGNIKNTLSIKNCRSYYCLNDKNIFISAGESIDNQHNYLYTEGSGNFIFDNDMDIDQVEIYNDNLIYINNNKLLCFSIKNQKEMWTVELGFLVNKEKSIDLFVLEDIVYVMSNNNIYTFEANSGKSLGRLIKYSYHSNANNLLLLPNYIYKILNFDNMVYIPRQDGYTDCFKRK